MTKGICKANPWADLKNWEIEICISKNCKELRREMIDWSSMSAASMTE